MTTVADAVGPGAGTRRAPAPGRLLIVSYFFNRKGPTGGFRPYAFAERLVARGWTVDVVCSLPGDDGMPETLDRHYPPSWGTLVQVPTPASALWPGAALNRIRSLASLLPSRRRAASATAAVPEATGPVDPSQLVLWTPQRRHSLKATVVLTLDGLLRRSALAAWSRAAEAAAVRLGAKHQYDAVLCSTPPHETQYAALAAARRLKVPLVTDLRDPWNLGLPTGDFDHSTLMRRLAARDEHRVLTTAKVVVHNTARVRDTVIAGLGAARRAEHIAITNGYDEVLPVAAPSRDVFRFCFTGWLHPSMDVRLLFAAVQRFRTRHDLPPEAVDVCFMGTAPAHGGLPLAGLAAAYGLERSTRVLPRMARRDALALQQSSAVLVAFDVTSGMAVPMKFYDYAQMCGAMLLFGERESALGDMAASFGQPVFAPGSDAAQDAYLDAVWARWSAGQLTQPIDAEHRLARDRQIEQLEAALGALRR